MKIVGVISLAVLLSACIAEYERRPVDGDYVLAGVDGREPGLCHMRDDSCEGLVEGPISAVGVGPRYLTALQASSEPAYFVIDKDAPEPGRVFGPMSEAEFASMRESHALPVPLPLE